jgi:galactose oxidase
MRNHRLVTLLAAAAMATVSGLAVASPAHAETANSFEIQSVLCLQPAGGSSGLGVGIVQGICNGSLAQQWAVASSSSGFHLVNQSSGLCLDARGEAVNGTPVEQWTCDWISNENWSWGNGRMSGQVLESGVSGTYNHCVSSPGEWTWFVQDVYLQSCNGQLFQQTWYHRLP